MLSQKTLADIVKDEIKDKIRKGEIDEIYPYYYILPDGKIYPEDDYDVEVANGTLSANDIYAYVDVDVPLSFDIFLFYINYLTIASVEDIVFVYLRKAGFTIVNENDLPPTPNLKYYIHAVVEYSDDTPEYLVINIYDIDALARTFHIPQIVEQKLGNKPREITEDELSDINSIVAEKQPLLAGHTYDEAWNILYGDYIDHKKKYKDEDTKLALAYMNLFPTPYEVCYEWEAGRFIKIDCAKIVLRSFSS